MKHATYCGDSGLSYIFEIHPPESKLNPRDAGIIMFCRQTATGDYTALYLEQTTQFGSHESSKGYMSASDQGMTHIGVLVVNNEDQREDIKRDLLQGLNPPCNNPVSGQENQASDNSVPAL